MRWPWEDRVCFDPATLAIGSLVAGGLGAGVSAIGAIGSAEARAQAASYQAQVARNNATIASQNAAYATTAGETQAMNKSLQAKAQLGAATAALAAGGVDVNTGSAKAAQVTQRELGNLDTAQVMSNAQLQAYGYRTQAVNYTAEAQLEQQEAEEAPAGGLLAAGGDLLSGFGSLGSNWAKFQQTGVLGS